MHRSVEVMLLQYRCSPKSQMIMTSMQHNQVSGSTHAAMVMQQTRHMEENEDRGSVCTHNAMTNPKP